MEAGAAHLNNPLVELENEPADLALQLTLVLIGCRMKRTLWYGRGWPWRCCLMGHDVPMHVQNLTAVALKSDY
eukprot:10086835-Prorocentrum_lima.AAC.1